MLQMSRSASLSSRSMAPASRCLAAPARYCYRLYAPVNVQTYALVEPRHHLPMQVWALLVKQSEANPVADNMGGSYLTMFSKGGFIFGA